MGKMRFPGGRGEGRYFFNMLSCFLIILLIPVIIMGGMWYQSVRRTNERQAIANEEDHMNAVVQEFQRKLQRAEDDLLSLIYGSAFNNYVSSEDPLATAIFRKDLKKYVKEPVCSIYVYHMLTDTILSSESGKFRREEFYDTAWIDQIESAVSLQKLSYRTNMDTVFYQKVSRLNWDRIYPVKTVLSIVSQKVRNVYLIANLDIELMGAYLCSALGVGERNAVIADQSGNVLFSNEKFGESVFPKKLPVHYFLEEPGKMYRYSSGDTIYFAQYLGYENLYYIESIQTGELYATSRNFFYYILGIVAAVIVFLSILAYFITRRLYQPLGELYKAVSPEGNSRPADTGRMADEIEIMKRTFDELSRYQKNDGFETKKQSDFVSSAMFRMLLNGIIDQESFRKEKIGIFGDGRRFYQLLVCCLSVCMEGEKKKDFSGRLQNVVNTYLSTTGQGILCEMNPGIFAVLYGGNTKNDVLSKRDFLIETFNTITEEQNYYAASDCFAGEASVREHYMKCGEALNAARFFGKKGGSVYGEPGAAVGEYSYRSVINYETGFIRAIFQMDSAAAGNLAARLREELLQKESVDYAVNVCRRILITVDKEADLEKSVGGGLLAKCDRSATLDDIIHHMEESFQQAIRVLKENTGSEAKYYHDAIDFIQNNYWKGINITEVADALGISYVYLNKIFKSQSEGNGKLLDYLNLLRIEKAKELLKGSGMPLSDVAEKVGYNNVQSFSRFFKKYEGITPGDYRKLSS